MRIGLLPLVIAVAALTLVIRLDGLMQGIEAVARESQATGSAPQAKAEDKAPRAMDAEPAKSAATGPRTLPVAGKTEAAGAATGPLPASGEALSSATVPALPAELPADPFSLTDSEIELLQALSQRRRKLDDRARDVESREALLAAAETRINEKLEELKRLRSVIEDLVSQYDAEEEAQLQSLVKIYETMKPKDAARIFEQLEMPVLLDVVERMSERKTAPILAEMVPSRAKEVTVELSNRRDLPFPRD